MNGEMPISAAEQTGLALAILAYLGAASAAFAAARATRSRGWITILVALAALTVIRAARIDFVALGGITQMAAIGRWYAERREYQRIALIALFAAIPLCGLIALRIARPWGERVAVLAALALALFVAVRAISYHSIDAMLGRGIGPFTLSRAIEFGLLGTIVLLARLSWGYPGRAPFLGTPRSP